MHKVVIVLRLVRKAAVPHWTAAFCICETNRLPGRKMPLNLHRGCSEEVPGRKRHLFRRGTGIHPPPEQKNAPQPARNVLRRHLRQKKASFPARNGIPTASRAGKCPSTCAESAPRKFRAEKGIFSGAEREYTRLPSRKMPLNLRGMCSGGI